MVIWSQYFKEVLTMQYRYILEMIVLATHDTYRWKQITIGNDLEELKEMANSSNKYRIIDIEDNFNEVYRTAPDTHFELLKIVCYSC